MHCTKCGAQIEDDAVICKQCGNNLDNETAEKVEVSDPSTTRAKSKVCNHVCWKLGIIATLLGIVILAAIVLVGLIVYGEIYLYNGYAFTGRLCTLSFILIQLGLALCVIGAVLSHTVAQLWSKKKVQIIVTGVLAIVCCFVITSSYLSEKTSQSSPSYGSSQSSNKLTTSEKEEIAETQAIANVVDYLNMAYSNNYDVSATRYKLGAITRSGDEYTVNGTLYLYDKYGNLADTATFSQKVEVNDYGISRPIYNPIINFN